MTAKTFYKKYSNTVKGGFSKVKILNRARKWGLRDAKSEVFEYFGNFITLEQCEEFERTSYKNN